MGIAADHRSWQDVIADKEELKMVALPVAGGFRALLAPRRGAPGPALADKDVSPRDGVDAPRAQPLRVARAPDVPDRDAPEVQEAEHASPSVAGRRADPAARDVLRATVKDFERVVIDCPDLGVAGGALGDVDAGVLVVPPTMPGVRRAAAVLERHDAVRWAVVLNRMGPGGETTRAELHRVLGRRTALELPCSPSLRDAEDDARLVTSSWTRYVRRVDRLLHALEGGP